MNKKFDRTIPSQEEAVQRIRSLFAKKHNKEQERLVIAGIDDRLNITPDYVHSIDNQHILHSYRKHSKLRNGEIPITEEDYDNIPKYIKNYDRVYKSPNKSKHGLEVIVYEKTLPDGDVLYLEEIRGRRKSLTFVTMRKEKGDNLAASSSKTDSPVRPKPSLSSSPSGSKDISF